MKIIVRCLIGLGFIIVAFLYIAPPYVEQSMNHVTPHPPWPVSNKAQALHNELIIGDWHSDSLLWNRNLLKQADYGHVDFPRLVKGNVAVQVFTAVTKSPKGQNYQSNSANARDRITPLVIAQAWPIKTWNSVFERARYQAKRLHDLEQQAPERIRIIKSRDDLDTLLNLRRTGSTITGALIGMEGAHALEGTLDNLDILYNEGYRLVGLQHFFDNELGGSLHGKGNAGLTDFGKQVVKRALEKHMIIDVAHASQQVVKDVLAMTNKPIVLSHTGIYSHCNTQRNLPDTLMQRITANGGVVAIGYWRDVTCDDTPKGIVKTLRVAIDLLGEHHVSLGSDYDGAVTTQFDTAELAALTHEMLAQNFTPREIKHVMGENMLRVLRANLP